MQRHLHLNGLAIQLMRFDSRVDILVIHSSEAEKTPALAVAPGNSVPVARQPGVAAPVEAPAVQWRKLQCKLVVLEDDWIKISSFCSALRPKLLSNQAKRDYIVGSTAWRIGSGQGRKLVHKTHWDNKSGRRGGVPPLVVKRDALEQVFYKYYAKIRS